MRNRNAGEREKFKPENMKISLAQGGTVVGSDIGVPRGNVKRTNVPRWTSVPGY